MEIITHCLVLCVIGTAIGAGGYEYDTDYLMPSQCPPCDAKSCPQLTYCVGVVVKDHCGCCNRCSSELFQTQTNDKAIHTEPASLPSDKITETGN